MRQAVGSFHEKGSAHIWHATWPPHAIHTGEMLTRPNVLTLLVSATPFNVLGQPSYINEEKNVIKWFQPGEKGGAYMRLEDYLLTIPPTPNEDASPNTVRPSIRSDQLFDKNLPKGGPTKSADSDYILMADYIFSFCLYSALLWDKDNGVLKEAEDNNVTDAQCDAFMKEYHRLTGADAEFLKEGWHHARIKLRRVGKKLFWTRVDVELGGSDVERDRDRVWNESDRLQVKEYLKTVMSKIVKKQPPTSDTDLIVEDLLRSSSGEEMQLPDGSTKRVLCGRMTIIRWEPVNMWPCMAIALLFVPVGKACACWGYSLRTARFYQLAPAWLRNQAGREVEGPSVRASSLPWSRYGPVVQICSQPAISATSKWI